MEQLSRKGWCTPTHLPTSSQMQMCTLEKLKVRVQTSSPVNIVKYLVCKDL